MAKQWLIAIPAEIRELVYIARFRSTKVHIHKPRTMHKCRRSHLCAYRRPPPHQDRALNILLTCKQVNAEASSFSLTEASFQMISCNCWPMRFKLGDPLFDNIFPKINRLDMKLRTRDWNDVIKMVPRSYFGGQRVLRIIINDEIKEEPGRILVKVKGDGNAYFIWEPEVAKRFQRWVLHGDAEDQV